MQLLASWRCCRQQFINLYALWLTSQLLFCRPSVARHVTWRQSCSQKEPLTPLLATCGRWAACCTNVPRGGRHSWTHLSTSWHMTSCTTTQQPSLVRYLLQLTPGSLYPAFKYNRPQPSLSNRPQPPACCACAALLCASGVCLAILCGTGPSMYRQYVSMSANMCVSCCALQPLFACVQLLGIMQRQLARNCARLAC
jgi:hypothetical protein